LAKAEKLFCKKFGQKVLFLLPCALGHKLKEQGGRALAGFRPGKAIARRLRAESRVSLPAGHRENSVREQALRAIIDMSAARRRF
jgi:hypothetical protein